MEKKGQQVTTILTSSDFQSIWDDEVWQRINTNLIAMEKIALNWISTLCFRRSEYTTGFHGRYGFFTIENAQDNDETLLGVMLINCEPKDWFRLKSLPSLTDCRLKGSNYVKTSWMFNGKASKFTQVKLNICSFHWTVYSLLWFYVCKQDVARAYESWWNEKQTKMEGKQHRPTSTFHMEMPFITLQIVIYYNISMV